MMEKNLTTLLPTPRYSTRLSKLYISTILILVEMDTAIAAPSICNTQRKGVLPFDEDMNSNYQCIHLPNVRPI